LSDDDILVSENVAEIHAITKDTRTAVEDLVLRSQLAKLKSWLSAPDPSHNLNEARRKRQEGTGSWFLQSRAFENWRSGTDRYLWLTGIPGCGKTVLSATIIEHLNKQQHGSSHVILYFFFDFTDSRKQTLDKLLRSLVMQLYSKCENSRGDLEKLLLVCENGHQQPSYESLFTTFIQMMGQVEKLQIVIDALDECTTRGDLLLWMKDLENHAHSGLYLLVTSRKEEDIESGLRRWLNDLNTIPFRQDDINRDIRAYVHEALRADHRFERWHSQPLIRDEIETALVGQAHGM
jgi:Cdc6-like AAA superfamily ATPase